jgi:hypothetical protein
MPTVGALGASCIMFEGQYFDRNMGNQIDVKKSYGFDLSGDPGDLELA